MTWVKICGLRHADDVAASVAAGASAVGFVLADSPRRVSVEEARALARHADGIARIAVFRVLDADAVAAAVRAGCTHLQAIGDAAAFAALPASLVPLPVVADDPGSVDRAADLRTLGVPLVFDSPSPGTGKATSTSRATSLARGGPTVLAGGLDPENVAVAIASVRPFGVDVSSGVERKRGEKDAARIHDFVRAARAAFTRFSVPEVPPCR